MASEMSKNMLGPHEQEATSQHRQRSVGCGGYEEMTPLERQSSIYSLTLEELQNTVCESGRNFGSMNMDEFLANIWNAEEVQAPTGGKVAMVEATPMTGAMIGEGRGGGGLNRQGSLSVPTPLSRKTVEEVWAEIRQGPILAPIQPQAHQPMGNGDINNTSRQQTLGEMTLEDFLVKAGVVREAYGTTTNQATMAAPTATAMATTSMAPMQGRYGNIVLPPGANILYPGMGDGMAYANGYNRMAVLPPPPAPALAVAAPMSSGSSDGLGMVTLGDMMSSVDNGTVMSNNGRKRGASEAGTVEKTVERRQRRMIKNRESAARSRARKQAYTVELEAELNQLKEENMRLKAEEKTIQLAKKQMLVEKMIERSKENMNTKKGAHLLHRCSSCFW